MVALETPLCNFDEPIHEFELPGVDGRQWSNTELMGEKGLVIAFICNHCPFVKAIQTRLVNDALELKKLGINMVAINSNDTDTYPEDSFENMRIESDKYGYPFPYLFDESQEVAKTFAAVCTPDFFAYNGQGLLQYRGRLDAAGRQFSDQDMRRDLLLAMQEVANTGKGPKEQIASIGCSIKWRE